MPSSAATPAGQRRPGRPAVLDKERIVAAALAIAAEDGAAAVSISRVASRLGVHQSALYYHVRNAEDLLGLVAAALLQRMPVPDVGLDWDRWLDAFAHDFGALLRDEPLLTRVPYLAVHQPFPPEVTERALTVMTRAGFDRLDAIVAFGEVVRKVVDLVHAEHARREEALNGRAPLHVLRERAKQAPDDELPLLRAVLDELAGVPDDAALASDVLFEWNLRLELAGLTALLEGHLPENEIRRQRGPGGSR